MGSGYFQGFLISMVGRGGLLTFVKYRGSVFHSGCERWSANIPNNLSLPPPRRIWLSFVLKLRYGTMEATMLSQLVFD